MKMTCQFGPFAAAAGHLPNCCLHSYQKVPLWLFAIFSAFLDWIGLQERMEILWGNWVGIVVPLDWKLIGPFVDLFQSNKIQ
jgi:hypothetical protein